MEATWMDQIHEGIIETIRDPLLILDEELRVITASRSFYEFFKVKPEETVGQFVYDLGSKQWDIPKLRELLEIILPQKTSFDNYEVEHDFTTIGKRTMLLNARQIEQAKGMDRIILLAIEDVTERIKAEQALRKSKEHSTFLAETAFELVELTSIQEIYAYTVQKLYKLFEANAIVALVEYNQRENRWEMQQIEGVGNKAAELSSHLGFDLNNIVGEISTKYYQQITSGKLEELAFDFPGLFNNKLSAAVGSAVKKLLSAEKMYCIAIHHDEHIMGNVTIITHKKTEPGNTKLIEAFIQQITTFVKKQKAEDNIREKDIQFRKLSTNLPDLIFQCTRRPDGSYHVPIASEGIKNIFGCQPEDVADNSEAIARVLHPDDAERVFIDFEYSAEHLTFYSCEFRVLIPGRPVQWILSRSTPEKLPDGSVTWYGFNANITQQKQTEQALRESEDKYRRIADNVTDVVWVTDLEMNPTYVSPSVERVLGIKPEDYLQLPVTQTYPPTSLEQFKKTLAEEFAKERDPESDRNRIFQLEVERYYADGTIGWDAISANFIRDEQNKPIAIQGVSRDITERIKAEEALRESEERFHQLFERAPLGYQSLDSDGRFIDVNVAWLETLGYKREEVMGKWFGDFLAPEYVKVFRERFPVFKAEGSVHTEFHMIHKDGSRRYIAFDGRIGHNADGSFKQTYCILKDVTAQKQAEESLRESEDLLTRSQEIAHTGSWKLDLTANRLTWSDEVYRIFGCKPQEFTPSYETFLGFVHPEDRAAEWTRKPWRKYLNRFSPPRTWTKARG